MHNKKKIKILPKGDLFVNKKLMIVPKDDLFGKDKPMVISLMTSFDNYSTIETEIIK